MTAYGSIESAVDTIKYGAKDYFVKSNDLEELIIKVERLAKLKRLEEKSNILLKTRTAKICSCSPKTRLFSNC